MSEQPVSPLEAHLGYWLRFVSNQVSHSFALKLAAREVTVAEWVVLRELFACDAMVPSVLAERIGMTRGGVSKLVDRLVDKSLVKRIANETDRRYQALALTAKGRALVAEARGAGRPERRRVLCSFERCRAGKHRARHARDRPPARPEGRAGRLIDGAVCRSRQRHQAAAVALQAPGDLEFQEHHPHHGGRTLRQPHQIIDQERRRAEQPDDAGALVGRRFGLLVRDLRAAAAPARGPGICRRR